MKEDMHVALTGIANSLRPDPVVERDHPNESEVMKFAHGEDTIRLTMDGRTLEATNGDGEVWFLAQIILPGEMPISYIRAIECPNRWRETLMNIISTNNDNTNKQIR